MNTLGWGALDVGSRRLLVELERTRILHQKIGAINRLWVEVIEPAAKKSFLTKSSFHCFKVWYRQGVMLDLNRVCSKWCIYLGFSSFSRFIHAFWFRLFGSFWSSKGNLRAESVGVYPGQYHGLPERGATPLDEISWFWWCWALGRSPLQGTFQRLRSLRTRSRGVVGVCKLVVLHIWHVVWGCVVKGHNNIIMVIGHVYYHVRVPVRIVVIKRKSCKLLPSYQYRFPILAGHGYTYWVY